MPAELGKGAHAGPARGEDAALPIRRHGRGVEPPRTAPGCGPHIHCGGSAAARPLNCLRCERWRAFVGAYERIVHRILGINIVTCERLGIATQSGELAEHVEAGLSTHHDECTKPSAKLIPHPEAMVRLRRCGLHGLAGPLLRTTTRLHGANQAVAGSALLVPRARRRGKLRSRGDGRGFGRHEKAAAGHPRAIRSRVQYRRRHCRSEG